MKNLEFNQMEEIQAGGCGKVGGAMGVAGGILTIALLASPAGAIGVSLGWVLAAAFGTSFSVAGIGCGLADLLE